MEKREVGNVKGVLGKRGLILSCAGSEWMRVIVYV